MVFRRGKSAAHRRMMVVSWTPLRRSLVLLGLVAAMVSAVLAGYLWAVRQSELDRDYLGHLGGQNRVLELELEDASRQLADVNLAREVDREALAIQRDEMAELHKTVREMREQLGFYRRLMDASSPGQALEVADFEVFGGEGSGTYRFRLLLTRPTEQGDWISGTARLVVSGLQGGNERELSLPEISETASYPLEYRFRYFQRLSGSLTLPEGFRPLRVTVRLFSPGGNTADVERTFRWSETSG